MTFGVETNTDETVIIPAITSVPNFKALLRLKRNFLFIKIYPPLLNTI